MNRATFTPFEQLHDPLVASDQEREQALQRWYQHVADRPADPNWLFMNFGYADLDPLTGEPLPDQGHTPLDTGARLYTRVATPLALQGKRVLEIGCGRGGGAITIKRRLKPRSVIGVDLSAKAIDHCQASCADSELSFQVANATNLPFADASFDAVLNVESSHAYADFPAFMHEVRRVLIPGGLLGIADVRFATDLDAWKEAIIQMGFEIIEEEDITPNVLAAMQLTSPFTADYINRVVPPDDMPHFREFAGVTGSWYFNSLLSGLLRYRRFVLKISPAEA